MKYSTIARNFAFTVSLIACFNIYAAPPTGQLAHDIVPLHYDLTLTIVPERDGFSGHEEIKVEIREPTNVIWIHGSQLDVSAATLTTEDGETLDIDYEQINETGLVRLDLPREVEPQQATLRFEWQAPYSEELDGLYKVVVDNRAYTFTQFEPISAREVFPSFDDPAFKTPYDISLIVSANHAAITATPPERLVEMEDGLVRIDFQTTKPLPTYLIAFAVGPLDVVEAEPIAPNAVRSRPLPLRGVAVHGKGDQLRYALEHTPAILAAQERYTGIPFPYKKLDIIAVPNFEAGAMENVGAVTFREYLLLLGEDAPLSQKRSFARVMAHELAHFWFGNLVTVPWWNDIWLNEAFATWFAAKGVDPVWPEYKTGQRLLDRIFYVMGEDSLVSARQIRQPIASSDDIYNAFDGITYTKGAAILRMFEQFLGKEEFQQAVREYLESRAHGNGDYQDFIAAVAATTEYDIAPAFESFLNQSGVPLLRVKKSCTGGAGELTLSQSRYLPLGSSGDAEQSWTIPVCIRWGADGRTDGDCLLMSEQQTTIDTGFCPAWIMPNANGAGYYRWSVDGDGYRALMAVRDTELGAYEQMSLADSIGAALAAGRLSFDAALSLLAQFMDSTNPALIEAPMSALEGARTSLASTPQEQKQVQLKAQNIASDAFSRLALLPVATPEVQALKEEIVSFYLFTARDPAFRDMTADKGVAWLGAPRETLLDSALLAPTLAVALQERGIEVFNALVSKLKDGLNAHQRRAVVRALGHASDPETIAALRELIFSDVLRSNEIRTLLRMQASMEATRAENWNWIQTHFDRLVEVMPRGHTDSLPGMATGFCSSKRARAVEAFFEPRIEAIQGGRRNLEQALEQIEICAAIKAWQRPHFIDWLKSETPNGAQL